MDCIRKCCNTFGDCPNITSSLKSRRDCKYFYYDLDNPNYNATRVSTRKSIAGGGAAGIAVGAAVGVIVLVVGIIFLIRKCRAKVPDQ